MRNRIVIIMLVLVIALSCTPIAMANTDPADAYTQRFYLETDIMMNDASRQNLRNVDLYPAPNPQGSGSANFSMGEMRFIRGIRTTNSTPQTAVYEVTGRNFERICGLLGASGGTAAGTLTIRADGKDLVTVQTDGRSVRRVEADIPEGVWQISILIQKTSGDTQARVAFADAYFAPAATAPENPHSAWAATELARAKELDLIPESLRATSIDYRQPITRAEFAVLAVKTFEFMSITSAQPAARNPFTDTTNEDVLKALNSGIMGGMSATTFEPNTLLNREQTAVALTRVFKRVTMPGWTLATDADFPFTFTWPPLFSDDSQMSPWARESIYFMAANGIMDGMGGNQFQPKTNASREQAILIALRLVEN